MKIITVKIALQLFLVSKIQYKNIHYHKGKNFIELAKKKKRGGKKKMQKEFIQNSGNIHHMQKCVHAPIKYCLIKQFFSYMVYIISILH